METAVTEAPVRLEQDPALEPEEVRIEVTRPPLYPEQEAAIYDQHRYSLIEATTKGGKTSGCLCWISEQAVTGQPNWHYWWVSPILAQAKIAFRRLKAALNPDAYRANESELTITLLATRTVIDFKGADHPDSLYGEDVHACVIDEASRVKEDAWHAIRTTLTATRGPIRIIGNVKGRKNWFFKLCRKAAAGEPDCGYHRITHRHAVAAGVLDAAEIEDARRKLPDHVFRQLYEAEAADDEGNPFGIEAIRRLVCQQLSTEAPTCWGWDLAKSYDWTVGIALDRHGNVCRMVRFQAPWGATKERIKAETGSLRCLVDSTGVGDPIVEDLVKMGVNAEPFLFTARSKQQLMEGLASDIQQGKGRLPEGVLVDELEAFEYTYTGSGVRYSAPEGFHDDTVCAYALARVLYRQGYGEPFVFTRLRDDDHQEQLCRAGSLMRSARHVQLVE